MTCNARIDPQNNSSCQKTAEKEWQSNTNKITNFGFWLEGMP